ncbi:hypothetical protein ABZ907_38640 [Nonomuraea wenchangensis]
MTRRGDAGSAESRRRTSRGAVISALGALLSAATCLPTWFGVSWEDLGKVLEALGGVATVTGATMALKSLPGFLGFIRPALRLLLGTGYLVVLLVVIAVILAAPRAATGYMDIGYARGDMPQKARFCSPILDFGWCEDAYKLRLAAGRPATDTTYRVDCFAYCGGHTFIRLALGDEECPEAAVAYEVTGVVPPAAGELTSAAPESRLPTDGMSPGQEIRIRSHRTDTAGCAAEIVLIAEKLE